MPRTPSPIAAPPQAFARRRFAGSVSVPARTPQAIVDRLRGEALEVPAEPEVRARLADIGMTPDPTGSAAFTAFIREEQRKRAPVIQQPRVRVQ